MTKTEATKQLKKLHNEKCICGEESLKVLYHEKCPYRMAAWLPEDLRPFAGGLYTLAGPGMAVA